MLRQGSSTGVLHGRPCCGQAAGASTCCCKCRMHSGRIPLCRHQCRLLPCSSLLIKKSHLSDPHASHGYAECMLLITHSRCTQHPCHLCRPSMVSPYWTCLSARRAMTLKDEEQPWDRLLESSVPLQAAAPPQSQASSHSVLLCVKACPHLHLSVPHHCNVVVQ